MSTKFQPALPHLEAQGTQVYDRGLQGGPGTVPVRGVAGALPGRVPEPRPPCASSSAHSYPPDPPPAGSGSHFLTLKAAQLLLQLDGAKTDQEHQAWRD